MAERLSPITTKGDLILGDTNGNVGRLPVGVNGTIPIADSTQTFGVRWTTPNGGIIDGVYRFDNSTTGADPGTGDLRLNNATYASVTEIYISQTTNYGFDAGNILGTLDDGDVIYIQERDDATKWFRATLNAAPTDNGAWWTLTVDFVNSGGTLFDNNDLLNVILVLQSAGGGGSGTVNTGAALKAAYYPSGGTTVDDWIGVEFNNTNLNTKIISQATTAIGLEIKGIASQSANLLNISSSSGTADLGSINASGYAQFIRLGIGTAPDFDIHIETASNPKFAIENTGTNFITLLSGASLNIFQFYNGTKFGIQAAATITDGGAANYTQIAFGSTRNTSFGDMPFNQSDFGAQVNVHPSSTSKTGLLISGFEDGDAILGLWADEGDDNADKWFINADKTDNDLTFYNNTTEKFRVLNNGSVKIQTIAQDDTETKIVVWNSTDKILEWRASTSLGGGSGITRTVVVTSGSITLGSAAATDYMYFVAGAHTLSMPAASGNTNRYSIKNNHSANITIDTAGAENIEGAASISIAPEESVDVMSDGTNWFII